MRKVLLIAVIAISSQLAIAQLSAPLGMGGEGSQGAAGNIPKQSTFVGKFGFKVGGNRSHMIEDESFDAGFSAGYGFRGGVVVNMRWGKRTESSNPGTGVWGLQPELMYSFRQYKTDGGDIQFHMVEIPVMAKIYPATHFCIEVGPQFNYHLHGAVSPKTLTVDGSELALEDIKGLNMAAAAGIAYEGESGFNIGARFSYGFTDMASNLKWKETNLEVSIGWLF